MPDPHALSDRRTRPVECSGKAFGEEGSAACSGLVDRAQVAALALRVTLLGLPTATADIVHLNAACLPEDDEEDLPLCN